MKLAGNGTYKVKVRYYNMVIIVHDSITSLG